MTVRRLLVTGAQGFVGQHLLRALPAAFPQAEITGTGLHAAESLDITDRAEVHARIAKLRPEFCVHLAAISAVGAARRSPDLTWRVNLHGALNLAEAILASAPDCRMIFVSTSECYGRSFSQGHALDETAMLAPGNLYAASKAAAELALGAMVDDGLKLLRLRPFNHTGPGQSEAFVVPAFAAQIARIEAGLSPPEIAVGRLDAARDFLDVRDVCNAYIACIARAETLPNNQIINLSSGRAVRIGSLLEQLLAMAKCPIAIREDPDRLRPTDIPFAAGDNRLAERLLGWRPQHELAETLATVLAFARQQTNEGGAR